MKTTASWTALSLTVLLCAPSAHAVKFDWATVGNPGNAPDTRYDATGVGSVGYTYKISKYEVTAGQYTEFLNAVATDRLTDIRVRYDERMWTDTFGCKIERTRPTPLSYSYRVEPGWENRPVNYVSFVDAMRFVNWLHNGQGNGDTETGVYNISNGLTETRSATAKYWIPSEDEWYKAAYHKNDGVTGNYFEYPTGSDTVPNYVNRMGNLSGSGDLFVEGGTDPGNYATWKPDNGFGGIGSPYYTTEVGEWENSPSPYGTYDQGGNVNEWNESIFHINHPLFHNYTMRGTRGGSFISDGPHALGPRFRGGSFSHDGFYALGFRVATIPEPSSVMLLGVLSAAGLLLRIRV